MLALGDGWADAWQLTEGSLLGPSRVDLPGGQWRWNRFGPDCAQLLLASDDGDAVVVSLGNLASGTPAVTPLGSEAGGEDFAFSPSGAYVHNRARLVARDGSDTG